MHKVLATSYKAIQICVLILLSISCLCAQGSLYPPGDLDQNYTVNLDDLVILAEQWLDESGCLPPNCAEIDGVDVVTMSDYSIMAANWYEYYGLPLVINEFMASNGNNSGISDPQGENDDWLEIYNYGERSIDLAGMYLTDDLDNATAWQFPIDRPTETTVDPNSFLIVWADGDISDTPGLHASFQLSSDGEEIGLYESDGVTLTDSLIFDEQVTNLSYGRWPDRSDSLRYFATASPGSANNDAYLGVTEDTKFSHDRGFYDSPISLTITCSTPEADIYYTTNGSAPIENEVVTADSVKYTGPIAINTNSAIRAAAIKTGWMPTNIDTHTYIFDATDAIKDLPVMCLVGDPDKTFWGPNGIMSHFTDRGIEFERPVSFELIDFQAGVALQEDCGIRIHGSDHTRPSYTVGDDWCTCWYDWWPHMNTNKIGFNLWFRNEYGDNRLEYPFFPFIDVDRFRSIVLRQGKNDPCTPFVKDEWARRLFQEMGRTQVCGTFASLYLNGEYKSYYNPTARGDEEFYQEWYDTDNDFDVITQSGVRDGDANAWNSLLSYIDSHDLSIVANYEYVASKFDIPTFIDFLIIEIHIANFDWPNNNWDVHRERSEDGIFRFSIWDAEGVAETWVVENNWGINAFDDMPSYDPQGLNGGQWPICRIYRGLKANAEFRQMFADSIHHHYRNGGVMSESHLIQRWWEVFGEVSDVLPETVNYPVRFVPDEFLPRREVLMLQAFEDNNLFDVSFGYPIFNVNGNYQHGGMISVGDEVTIPQSTSLGDTYYTTDGSDPRVPAITEQVTEGFLLLSNATKKVLVPTGDIGDQWRGGGSYIDSDWTSGTGSVGYETSSGYESLIDIDVENEMRNKSTTCYIRTPFTIDGSELPYSNLELRIRYDDGFIAYINGTEVKRVNSPASPLWNSKASGSHEASASWNSYDISSYASVLHDGQNILAIQGLNYTAGSSDFLISAELESYGEVVVIEPGISPSAIEYTGGISMTESKELNARILSGDGQWSVLNKATFGVGDVSGCLRVSEIMYNPQDPNNEFIELINIGSESINLNMVRLTKGVDFTFGSELLNPDEHILIVRNQNSFVQQYPTFTGRIAGEYEGNLDNGGEKIRIRDALDIVIQEFSFKDGWYNITDGDGFSLTICDVKSANLDLWNEKDGWRPSSAVGGSPGGNDTGIIPEPGSIVINELLAHSHQDAPDWIELFNTTAQTINIGGWFLSDDNDNDANIKKYEIPVGTSIAGGGYIVFREDLTFGNPSADGVNIAFGLSEGGETVYLRSGTGGIVSGYSISEDFGASASNVAFGRHIKSVTDDGVNFVAMSTNSPGSKNSYPEVGPIVISEIMYNTEASNTGGEYLELHNITNQSVTLEDIVSTESQPGIFISEAIQWTFSDGIDYDFPANTTIPAKGYLIITKNPAAFTNYYGIMPTEVDVLGPFQNNTGLNNGGERIQIVRPGDQEYGKGRYWIRTERVFYDDSLPWPESADGDGYALHQKTPDKVGDNYGNDVINWQAASPNPGQ